MVKVNIWHVVCSHFFGVLLLSGVLLFLNATAQSVRADGNALFVTTDGSGSACTQSQPCDLATALDEATEGDSLYLAAGTYEGDGDAVITVTEQITIYGGWDGSTTTPLVRDADVYTTTLDGENTRRVVYGATDFMLDGLHLTNGNASGLGLKGGALYANMKNVALIDCVFTNNVAYTASLGASSEAYGGAVYLLNPNENTEIRGCHFENNLAADAPLTKGYGGALRIEGGMSGYVQIHDSTFKSNIASEENQGFGGAISMSGGGRDYLITDNVIQENYGCNGTVQCQGGGIHLFYGDTITMTSNTIENNQANIGSGEGFGGGMMIMGTDVKLSENIIQKNQAAEGGVGGGGGMRVNQGTLDMTANLIFSNTASLHANAMGGGLWLESGNFTMTNNILADNHATLQGAGIYAFGVDAHRGTLDMRHNTLVENEGTTLKVVNYFSATLTNNIAAWNEHAFSLAITTPCTISADSTLFWGNATDITGTNSVVGDPKFVDRSTWDYHLMSDSAAIDAGVDAGVYVDKDGNVRPSGSGFDIGAYEYWVYLFLPFIAK
jgi:hypothetical protein